MSELNSLKGRIEGARGPDRALDADILATLFPNAAFINGGPKLTSSVDAALALVERALPGCACGFQPSVLGGFKGYIFEVRPASVMHLSDGHAATPALAILSALITSLQHKDKSDA